MTKQRRLAIVMMVIAASAMRYIQLIRTSIPPLFHGLLLGVALVLMIAGVVVLIRDYIKSKKEATGTPE